MIQSGLHPPSGKPNIPSDDTARSSSSGPKSPLGLLRVTALFGGGNLLSTFLRLLGGVLTSRFVDPSVLGLFNGIGLVRGYVPFLQGGVSNGLNRDLPYLVGKGDREGANQLAAVAQAWLLLVSGLAVFGLLLVVSWHLYSGNVQLALGWASFAVPVFGVLFGDFYLRVLFATHGRFQRLAFIGVLVAFIGVATVVLVWWLGFLGLCLRGILVSGIMLCLLWKWRPLSVSPAWGWVDFKALISTGIPIFLVGRLYSWWPVFNSTLVLAYAGTQGLGLYAIANMAGPTVAMLPKALGQVVYPQMSEQYGRTGSISDLIRLVAVPTAITFGFTLLAVTVAWFAIPPAVALILPKYAEGVDAAQWSVAAALISSLTPVNNVFNVVKKQGRYGVAMIIGIASTYRDLRWLTREATAREASPQATILGPTSFLLLCLYTIGSPRRHSGH